MWPLILSLVARMAACQLICLKSKSARIPKIPLISTMEAASPSSSNGVSTASKATLKRRCTAFICGPARGGSADVAETLELLDDVGVGLRALELGQLLLQDVHDELLVRCVACQLRDLLDAVDQVRVELDLVATAEHVSSLLCCGPSPVTRKRAYPSSPPASRSRSDGGSPRSGPRAGSRPPGRAGSRGAIRVPRPGASGGSR